MVEFNASAPPLEKEDEPKCSVTGNSALDGIKRSPHESIPLRSGRTSAPSRPTAVFIASAGKRASLCACHRNLCWMAVTLTAVT